MEIENQEQEILMENEPFIFGGETYTEGYGININEQNEISVDTDEIQEKLIAGENITIIDNIISASKGEGPIIELTEENYNWPVENPQGIALWSLPTGFYNKPKGLKAYINGAYTDTELALVTIVSQGDINGEYTVNSYATIEYLRANGGLNVQRVGAGAGMGTRSFVLLRNDVVDNLISTSISLPLSAYQGKLLKEFIDELERNKQDTLTAGDNITIDNDNVISATDTTYSDFVGTDGTAVGTAGLVPAPATTDADKYLKSDGTWDTVNAGPTVVQTTGTSTTDVMSQNATTGMVFADPGNQAKIRIGNTSSVGTNSLSIGNGSLSTPQNCVSVGDYAQSKALGSTSLGYGAESSGAYGVSLGYGARAGAPYSFALPYSSATQQGIVQFGLNQSQATSGYNNSQYRLLSGLYDPVNDHDGATKGYVDNIVVNYAGLYNAGAPTTNTVAYYLGQFYYDTTNDDIYYCSDIDTTDPNNPVYTWSALPSGGGGPTVVQTTGTSTTDVMSQNATSLMVYDYVDSTRGYRPKIGYQAATGGLQSVAFGDDAKAGGQNAVAVGGTTSAYQNGAIALGYGATTSSAGEMNIGTSNTSYGYNSTNYRLLTGLHDPVNAHDAATKGYVDSQGGGGGPTVVQTTGTSTTDVMSQNATTNMVMEEANGNVKILANSGGSYNTVAIGKYAEATRNAAIAIGGGALPHQKTVASGINSVAIGYQAKATQAWSIALGDFAQTTRQGELNIGTSSENHGYNSTHYRVIGGVHDGQLPQDVATVSQINATIDAINTALSISIPHIGASS